MNAGNEPPPCWCRVLVGYVTHPEDEPCPTREHWLDVEDSEFPIPPAQCRGGIPSLSPPLERCTLPEGHEGECQ